MIFFAKNAAKHPHVLLVCIISYATAIVKPFIPLKTSVLLLSKPPPRYCSSRTVFNALLGAVVANFADSLHNEFDSADRSGGNA